jgi:hypothetical protein
MTSKRENTRLTWKICRRYCLDISDAGSIRAVRSVAANGSRGASAATIISCYTYLGIWGGFLPCGGARDSWGLGELALSLNSFIRSGWRLTVGAFPVDPGSGGGVVLSMYRPTSINA